MKVSSGLIGGYRSRLFQKILALVAFILGFVVPKSFYAATSLPTEVPSFAARALKVKKAFDQAKPFADQSNPNPHQMQWGNWPNWQNWGNWGNWNNWQNWQNWVNW